MYFEVSVTAADSKLFDLTRAKFAASIRFRARNVIRRAFYFNGEKKRPVRPMGKSRGSAAIGCESPSQ